MKVSMNQSLHGSLPVHVAWANPSKCGKAAKPKEAKDMNPMETLENIGEQA